MHQRSRRARRQVLGHLRRLASSPAATGVPQEPADKAGGRHLSNGPIAVITALPGTWEIGVPFSEGNQ
jgi:hypothetical protein